MAPPQVAESTTAAPVCPRGQHPAACRHGCLDEDGTVAAVLLGDGDLSGPDHAGRTAADLGGFRPSPESGQRLTPQRGCGHSREEGGGDRGDRGRQQRQAELRDRCHSRFRLSLWEPTLRRAWPCALVTVPLGPPRSPRPRLAHPVPTGGGHSPHPQPPTEMPRPRWAFLPLSVWQIRPESPLLPPGEPRPQLGLRVLRETLGTEGTR